MKRLILIDSDAIIHRTYHALPRFTNAQGTLINAVYGFMSILIKIINELRPDYLIATFDTPKPTFRHEVFKEYKGKRLKAPDELEKQIVMVKELLEKLGIVVLAQEGFEADDLIGSAARLVEERGLADEVLIVTGDLDTLQLVSNITKVYTMRKGIADVVVYDKNAVTERFGFEPKFIVDYKALRGDPSDNIPGIKGIGEKTAKDLVMRYGTLEDIIEATQKNKFEKKINEKIAQNEAMAMFSKQLAQIKTDIPLDFSMQLAEFSKEKLEKLPDILKSMHLSFKSLVERIGAPQAPAKELLAQQITEKDFKKAEIFLFDLTKEIFILAKNNVLYFKHKNEFYKAEAAELKVLKPIFENYTASLITFAAKPILKLLFDAGIAVRPFTHDLELASWLLNPEYPKHSIDFLARKFLGKYSVNSPLGQELTVLEELTKIIESELEKNGLTKVYKEIELPLTPVLTKIEAAGISLDVGFLKKLGKEVNHEIEKVKKEIDAIAEEKINLNSPKQLAGLLFEKLKLPAKGIRRTSLGKYSTQESELLKLKHHPIIEKIINLRSLSKLKSTYIEALPEFVSHEGKIYVHFIQTGTATGRLASAEPNLQNLPVSNDFSGRVRESLRAASGFLFAAFDYSQIELRALAHLSKDEEMIAAFKKGEDIHRKTAAAIFGVDYKNVSESQRQKAKMLNFGLIYGMGPKSFAENTGATLSEAKKFMEKYFIEFAGVKKFLEDTKEKARTLGYVETPFGRKRWIGEIGGGSIQAEKRLERMAVNMPIQGFATGDLIKLALINVQTFLEQEKLYPDKARMLLQIHDEILMEIKKELVSDLALKIKEIMEHVYPLKVPLEVKTEIGNDFYNLKSFV